MCWALIGKPHLSNLHLTRGEFLPGFHSLQAATMERWAIQVSGIVQGVGFRPFVYNLAAHHSLSGFVQNLAGQLLIEVEGEEAALDQFLKDLVGQPPPLAHVESLSYQRVKPRGDSQFRIAASEAGQNSSVFISPDVAVCSLCLAELFDPRDRRYRYPFLNCTNCGPRLTIVTGAPYDRSRTTMANFSMCTQCQAEYEDPGNRRFHAQPIACPLCGPGLTLLNAVGQEVTTSDPDESFARAITSGKIGALQGIGGYHLVCDAGNATAVKELRRRKHRDEKPFAIMVRDVKAAELLCEVSLAEMELLQSPQAPIVLLRKRTAFAHSRLSLRESTRSFAERKTSMEEIAPGNPCLGVMLPYSPLHHLLVEAVGGIPLVMTSGNRSDEPIVYRDDAVEMLDGIADLYLTHNRPIHVRCDDSVTRIVDGTELPVRRSRGYAPRPLALPFDCPRSLLAVGGQLKSTFALVQKRQAFLSHHMGDLDHLEAFRAFEQNVGLFQELFKIQPELLIHDLHPDYATTRYAIQYAYQAGIGLLGVQHHHAHMASCMAEHGLTGPVIGVIFDGTGFGTDGTIWGGEILTGGYREFHRAAHLRTIDMPGGDQAIQEPWRMAMAYLIDAECERSIARLDIPPAEERVVRLMLKKRFNCPVTSSMGRLFDAVAALAGVRKRVCYEGQAAIELEGLATEVPEDGAYPFETTTEAESSQQGSILIADTRPTIRAIDADVERGRDSRVIARCFHTTLVEMIAALCSRIRSHQGLDTVVLSGGVFLNALLTHEVCDRLGREKFRVYRHRLVPPNDGGLSLGQAAIGAAYFLARASG